MARRNRWTGSTPEQRHAEMAKLHDARTRAFRERKIADLIASAPPLTAQQKARLAALLNAVPEAEVA